MLLTPWLCLQGFCDEGSWCCLSDNRRCAGFCKCWCFSFQTSVRDASMKMVQIKTDVWVWQWKHGAVNILAGNVMREVDDECNGHGTGEYRNLCTSLNRITALSCQDGCNSWSGWYTSDAHLYQLRGYNERNGARWWVQCDRTNCNVNRGQDWRSGFLNPHRRLTCFGIVSTILCENRFLSAFHTSVNLDNTIYESPRQYFTPKIRVESYYVVTIGIKVLSRSLRWWRKKYPAFLHKLKVNYFEIWDRHDDYYKHIRFYRRDASYFGVQRNLLSTQSKWVMQKAASPS